MGLRIEQIRPLPRRGRRDDKGHPFVFAAPRSRARSEAEANAGVETIKESKLAFFPGWSDRAIVEINGTRRCYGVEERHGFIADAHFHTFNGIPGNGGSAAQFGNDGVITAAALIGNDSVTAFILRDLTYEIDMCRG